MFVKHCVIAAMAVVSCPTAIACSGANVTGEGYRGVTVGMTLQQASTQYGISLKQYSDVQSEDTTCYFVYPDGYPGGVAFMIYNNSVARVDIDARGPKTKEGIEVGSTEASVRAAYPDLVEKEHSYAGDFYLVVKLENGLDYVFETYNGVVSRYRAGKQEYTRLVEGCS